MSDERETIQRNPESVAAWKRECAFLREHVEKLEALVVMRCDLDVPPQFSQGLQPHEVLEPVTAEHCQWFVAEIEKLRKERETRLDLAEQNKQLKAELKSIDGALNDPRANLTLTTSEIILELKEQVDVLTEAYDQCGRTVQDYGRTIDQTESRLREVATHCANVEQQLAALAEQNEKMKADRSSVWMVATKVCMMLFATKDDADQSQSQQGASTYTVPVEVPVFGAQLPDLATPVLNRIKAEGMREAAEICKKENYWIKREGVVDAIRSRADELEKQNG